MFPCVTSNFDKKLANHFFEILFNAKIATSITQPFSQTNTFEANSCLGFCTFALFSFSRVSYFLRNEVKPIRITIMQMNFIVTNALSLTSSGTIKTFGLHAKSSSFTKSNLSNTFSCAFRKLRPLRKGPTLKTFIISF